MSTYNGGKYLEEQIESILNQTNVIVELLVRDDGSTDETIEILKKYYKKDKLRYVISNNVGSANSFFELINLVNTDYEYYAFSDQDDYWMKDKLSHALDCLDYKENNDLQLYYSSTTVVNDQLKELNKKYGAEEKYNFITSLFRNNAIGCTMVFNKELLFTLKKYHPKYMCMHDQWINLVCLSLGGFVYVDDISKIKYRQHQNNCVGAKSSIVDRIKQSSLSSKGHTRLNQALELLSVYGSVMNDDILNELQLLVKYNKSIVNTLKCCRLNFSTHFFFNKVLIYYSILFRRF